MKLAKSEVTGIGSAAVPLSALWEGPSVKRDANWWRGAMGGAR